MATADSIIDLFLCHASPDKPWVRELAAQLESETFDGHSGGRQLRVFLDEWDIEPGASFFDRIEHGLTGARYVAVVLSPAFLRAPFARMEAQHVLADDPMNRQQRVLPLLYQVVDERGERLRLPAPFRVLNWIDFTEKSAFKRSFHKLVRTIRDLPPVRGRAKRPIAGIARPAAALPAGSALATSPDLVNEVILSNLLPVERFPATVWSAATTAQSKRDVFKIIKDPPPFEVQGKRLYTFVDLSSPRTAFDTLLDPKSIRSEPIANWHHDPVRARWLVSMFNSALRRHFGKMAIWWNREHRMFFFPSLDGRDRSSRNGRDRARTVAAKRQKFGSDLFFWVHHAANLETRLIGDAFYILVSPTYGVSTDGKQLVKAEWVGNVKRAWGGKERNAAILRHVIFWGRTLSRGAPSSSIATGASEIVVSAIPALATTDFGLEWDSVRIRALLTDERDELKDVATIIEMSDVG